MVRAIRDGRASFMKRELQHKEIRFTIETIQQSDKTWKCEARIFITPEGLDIPILAGFDTEKEAEADTTNEVKWLIGLFSP